MPVDESAVATSQVVLVKEQVPGSVVNKTIFIKLKILGLVRLAALDLYPAVA
jgi:hypothetical protein